MTVYDREVTVNGSKNGERIARALKTDYKSEKGCWDHVVLLAPKIKT